MVEDNMEHIELCAEYLPKDRYQLVPALDGYTALELIKTGGFDLVVLDFALPDMNGMEVLKRLKRMEIGVPVVFVSAMNEPGLALQAMKEGACDYIVKTFGYYQTLKDRIEENLDACEAPGRAKK